MVKSVSSFTRNGLRDFLLQRLSAVYMAFFLLGFVIYLFSHDISDYYTWHKLFQMTSMRIFVILFLFSLMVHTQLGLWTIITDYLKDTFTRMIFMGLTLFVLLASMLWGFIVLWS